MKYHSFFSAYILLTDWCAVTLTDEQAKLNDKPEKLIISPSPWKKHTYQIDWLVDGKDWFTNVNSMH